VAEQSLGCGAERAHDAALVDNDHGIRNRVEDRLQLCFAGEELSLLHCGAQAGAVQLLATPGDANAHDGEGGGADKTDGRKPGSMKP
jgi:hypothetical protein